MIDEPVGGCVLVRCEAAAAGVLVVDLLLEQHRSLAEQLGEHLDDDAVADQRSERAAVVDEVLAPSDHRAGVGLLEVVESRPVGRRPSFEFVDRAVERRQLFGRQRHGDHQPTAATERFDVDHALHGRPRAPAPHTGATASRRPTRFPRPAPVALV